MRDLDQTLRQERSKPPGRDDRRASDLGSELASAQAEYRDVLGFLQRLDAESGPATRLPATLAEVQSSLDPDTTLLIYSGTQVNIIAFVVTRDEFHAIELPTKGSDLESVVELHDFAVPDAVPLAQLTDVYQRLVQPVRPLLHTHKLGIIGDVMISFIPFSALTDGSGHYLGEDFAIFSLPSASALPVLQARVRSNKDVLAVAQNQVPGRSILSHANDEANRVASLYGGRALLGVAASEAAFKNLAGSFGVLHIAAHTDIDATDGAIARIALSSTSTEDGVLQSFEVETLDLAETDLVVLSACQTQAALFTDSKDSQGNPRVGPYHAGEGVENLTRAFLRAGAKSVVGSLWEVDDPSTEMLMIAFHGYLAHGLGKAEALKQAQADTRRVYPAPYYWAGFVLTGDPGALSGAAR